MFILRQTSVKMAVLLHKQAKVPFFLDLAVLSGLVKTSLGFGKFVNAKLFTKNLHAAHV